MTYDNDVVYALEEGPDNPENTIFLAGPTPRSPGTVSWRPEAIRALRDAGFAGIIYNPESRDGVWHGDRYAQVEWESWHLAAAECIFFWVPREMQHMPALTTNLEWGTWYDSGKVVLGLPPEGVRNEYLAHHASQLGIPTDDTLWGTAWSAVMLLNSNRMETCVFCQITGPDEHHQVEWRGRDSVVITPRDPVVPGHRLVIPRVHTRDALEYPSLLARVMRDAAAYANAVGAGDCNIITSVGPAATQTVFHLHVHVVPRVEHDGLHLPWTGQVK